MLCFRIANLILLSQQVHNKLKVSKREKLINVLFASMCHSHHSHSAPCFRQNESMHKFPLKTSVRQMQFTLSETWRMMDK